MMAMRLPGVLSLVCLAVLTCGRLTGVAQADEPGVTGDTILFGQVAALEGPSAAIGQATRQGLLAAFNEINAKGGVHGRKLRLISRNDGYDPDRSVVETAKLIHEDKVFALIGAVGTPTAMATVPIAAASEVPFVGPVSGAEFLRDAAFRNVVNIRPSHTAEAEVWIKYLIDDLHLRRIGIFYQDDTLGRDVLTGVKIYLDRRGLELAAEGTFERNTRAVGVAFKVIKRAEPEAVIMVGTYGPCAEFIKMAHRTSFNPTFVAMSFVGPNALAKELGPEGRGVIISEVVPFPWNTEQRLVADYQAAQKDLDPNQPPDFISLEGYLTGRLVGQALEKAGPDVTRAALLRVIRETGRFDIGGTTVAFGEARRSNPPHVSLAVIQGDGSFKPIEGF